jgi:hypothetical protein
MEWVPEGTLARLDAALVRVQELEAVRAAQEATIATLEQRLRGLETRLSGSGQRGVPGTKPASSTRSKATGQPRKRRPHGFARRRSPDPTRQVRHVLDSCPHCQTALTGGWVKRRRELIDLPRLPVQVEEHLYIARRCAGCHQVVVPAPALAGLADGQQRLGAGLVSVITVLQQELRLPVLAIQTLLDKLLHLSVSVGSIVAAGQRVADHGKTRLLDLRDQIRASPAVQADETGWRETGRNGYAWVFCTPSVQYFTHGSRAKGMVDTVLGEQSGGVLGCDGYAAYNHYPGQKQRCWAHLLRAAHELSVLYPDEAEMAAWKTALKTLFAEAKAVAVRDAGTAAGRAARTRFELQLAALCEPAALTATAVHGRLCRHILRQREEWFVFVSERGVPADNNGAERALRHLVTTRKISGGSRSPRGTATRMGLASLFGTWRLRGDNPLLACYQLLTAPQV